MSAPEQVVVVGIDGLDVAKAQDWQPSLLGAAHAELDVSAFEMLRTSHIWPTMFAGETPVERGFDDPEADTNRANWQNPVLDAASAVGAKVIPRRYRRRVGWFFAERGYSADALGGYQKPYRELFEGDCVFTGLKSRVIEVPGWNKNELDIAFNRAGAWGAVMDDDDGVERFMHAIDEEADVKQSLTVESMAQPYDLVWTHFHFLDAVQHFFDESTQREWYERAADVLTSVQAVAGPETVVVVLSDHGLGTHGHRPPGLIAVFDESLCPLPERPHGVRAWLEEVLEARYEANEETVEHLEALGYRDFVGGEP